MDPNDNSSCESSFCKDEKVEAMNLLEECWFFDNLLNIKPKMLRSHSDPYPSTRLIDSDFLVKDKSAFVCSKKIQRTPSMPPIRVKKEDEEEDDKLVHQPLDPSKQHHCAKMKGLHHRRKSKLLRTPSLPPSIGREEKSQETYPRNGRSKKQPSTPTNIDKLPPRLTSKVLYLSSILFYDLMNQILFRRINFCHRRTKHKLECFRTELIVYVLLYY